MYLGVWNSEIFNPLIQSSKVMALAPGRGIEQSNG